MTEQFSHHPVLLAEVLANLNLKSDGVYVDATFGRGGHSRAILERLGPKGRLFAFDHDPDAWQQLPRDMAKDDRFTMVHRSFSELATVIREHDLEGKVDGILMDLGVSSPQLDNPSRGFSFLREGPLDMRMDPTRGVDAATWIAQADTDEIVDVLKTYGEERFAKRIAAAIVKEREVAPILTTVHLAKIVSEAHPRWEKGKHPATKSFQAIRIFINNELGELTSCLEQALDMLAVGGRILVICFHGLETKIVKRFFNRHITGDEYPRGFPVTEAQLNKKLKRVGKAIKPSAREVQFNPRSRSAIMRIAEKIA